MNLLRYTLYHICAPFAPFGNVKPPRPSTRGRTKWVGGGGRTHTNEQSYPICRFCLIARPGRLSQSHLRLLPHSRSPYTVSFPHNCSRFAPLCVRLGICARCARRNASWAVCGVLGAFYAHHTRVCARVRVCAGDSSFLCARWLGRWGNLKISGFSQIGVFWGIDSTTYAVLCYAQSRKRR